MQESAEQYAEQLQLTLLSLMKTVLLKSWDSTEAVFPPQGAEHAEQFEVCPHLFPRSWSRLCSVGFQSLWVPAPHSSPGAKRSRPRLLHCQVPKSWRRRICAGILISTSSDFRGEEQTEGENRENLLSALSTQWAVHGGFFFHWVLDGIREGVSLFTLTFWIF